MIYDQCDELTLPRRTAVANRGVKVKVGALKARGVQAKRLPAVWSKKNGGGRMDKG